MKDSTIKIVGEINVRDLNPYNFHLKNDYMENLLSTGFLILPILYEQVSNLKIINGFISSSFMRSKKRTLSQEDKRFTRGLALSVTFDNFEEMALEVAEDLYHSFAESEDEAIKITVDRTKKKLFVGRDYEESSLMENSENGLRTVLK